MNEFFEVVSRTDKTSEEANEKILEIFVAMFESLGIKDVDSQNLMKTFNTNPEAHKADQYPEVIEIKDFRGIDTIILNSNLMRLSGQTKPYNPLVLEASSHSNTFKAQEIADSNGKFTITIPNIPANELFRVAITDDFITDGANLKYKEEVILDQKFNIIYRQNIMLMENILFEILYITPYELNEIIVRFKITNFTDSTINPIREFQERIIIYQNSPNENQIVPLRFSKIKNTESNSSKHFPEDENVLPNNSQEFEVYYKIKYVNENIFYKINYSSD